MTGEPARDGTERRRRDRWNRVRRWIVSRAPQIQAVIIVAIVSMVLLSVVLAALSHAQDREVIVANRAAMQSDSPLDFLSKLAGLLAFVAAGMSAFLTLFVYQATSKMKDEILGKVAASYVTKEVSALQFEHVEHKLKMLDETLVREFTAIRATLSARGGR